MKKLPVLLALSVISAALLAGCGGSGKTDSTELRYASMKDIRNINPHLYLGEMAAQAMVFEPLVVSTKDGIKPWLAESWTISPDGHTSTTAFLLKYFSGNFPLIVAGTLPPTASRT